MILDYYLNLLAGVPAAHARARLTMLCCHDASPRPLTQKIIEHHEYGCRAGIAAGLQIVVPALIGN